MSFILLAKLKFGYSLYFGFAVFLVLAVSEAWDDIEPLIDKLRGIERVDYWGEVFKKQKARKFDDAQELRRVKKEETATTLAMVQADGPLAFDFDIEGEDIYKNFVWLLDGEVIYHLGLLEPDEIERAEKMHKRDVDAAIAAYHEQQKIETL